MRGLVEEYDSDDEGKISETPNEDYSSNTKTAANIVKEKVNKNNQKRRLPDSMDDPKQEEEQQQQRKKLLIQSLLLEPSHHLIDPKESRDSEEEDLFYIDNVVASRVNSRAGAVSADIAISLSRVSKGSDNNEIYSDEHVFDANHPSSQYAIRYGSGNEIYPETASTTSTTTTSATSSTLTKTFNDFNDDYTKFNNGKMLSGAEVRMQAPVHITSVSQRDILAGTQVTQGAGDGIRKLTNRDFASRKNHLTGLLSIAKERESAFNEHHQKAKKTKRESASRYGW